MVTTAYMQGLKHWQSFFLQPGRINSYAVLEEMTRRISLANEVIVSGGGAQLQLRWDYPLNSTTPNGTIGTLSLNDDTWVTYRFTNNKLYSKANGPQAPVTQPPSDIAADGTGAQEVQSGLVASNGSGFVFRNPTGNPSLPVLIEITLVTSIAGQSKTIQTTVTAGAKAKN